MRLHTSTSRRLSRRAAVVGTALALLCGVVAACSPPEDVQSQDSGTDTTGAGSTSDASGSSGGVINLGLVGNKKDQIFPYHPQETVGENAIITNVFDGLTRLNPDGSLDMRLAKSMESNADKTVWTVHLRPGVTFHDGSSFGADDVIYSVQKMFSTKGFDAKTNLFFVDPDRVKKIDKLTVKFHLKQPYGPFPRAWAYNSLAIVAKGSTKQDPMGTGPFKVQSFTPNREAVLTKYDSYWDQSRMPKFQKLHIYFFQDQSAIVHALLGGQIDLTRTVPYSNIQTLKNAGFKLLVSKSASHLTLDMRTDVPPFNDWRVRRAMKLIIDRDKVVSNAFFGYASVANDYDGNDEPCPAPDLPQRKQDLQKAKQLLKEAGKSNLNVKLVTDGVFVGMMPVAQLLAQEASKIGVTINVRKLDTASLLDKWLKWKFVVNISSSSYINLVTSHLLPDGLNNASHWNNKKFQGLASDLFAARDKQKRCSIIQQMQSVQYKRGGSIIPAFKQSITPYSSKIHGLKKDLYGRSSYLYGGVSVG